MFRHKWLVTNRYNCSICCHCMRHSLCRIIGFDDIGNSDDFHTSVLERRLQSSGKLKPQYHCRFLLYWLLESITTPGSPDKLVQLLFLTSSWEKFFEFSSKRSGVLCIFIVKHYLWPEPRDWGGLIDPRGWRCKMHRGENLVGVSTTPCSSPYNLHHAMYCTMWQFSFCLSHWCDLWID